MSQKFFEELRQRKASLFQFAEKAKSFGWIDDEQEKEIQEKLESDVLTIGVIGQMKSGKSTFLNAFVFEDAVLPAAISPMTAALSVITYGEEKKIVAEFYTQGEWEEQKHQAARTIDEAKGNELEESKIQAAKELMKSAQKLGEDVGLYLGKIQEDKIDNLVDYVGREGKYVSITKSVTIYYPKEYLKGVRIVDTPGLNDPIVSRELRTKQFLKEADAVVMMLYAGQAFSAKDKVVLFEDVKQCGIGKVVIGINKYDLPYESDGTSPQDIKQSVIEKIRRACAEYNDDTMTDMLLDADPILLSAEMALLSELPMDVILENESYNKAFHRYSDEPFADSNGKIHNLGIPYARFREESKIDELTNAIKVLVEKEKYDILLKKPANAIWAAGCKKRDEIVSEMTKNDTELNILRTPDEELEEKEGNLSKTENGINRRIEGLGEDLVQITRKIGREGKYALEDALDETCKKMLREVDKVGRFGSFDAIKPRLNHIYNEFKIRTAKRIIEQKKEDLKRELQSNTRNFFTEAEDVFLRFLPDVDRGEFVKSIARKTANMIDDETVFFTENANEQQKNDWWEYVLAVVLAPIELYGDFCDWVLRPFTHGYEKKELLNRINSINESFDSQSFADIIINSKDNVINMIKKMFVDEFLEPIKKKVKECRTNLAERANRLEQAELLQKELSSEHDVINEQIDELQALKETL